MEVNKKGIVYRAVGRLCDYGHSTTLIMNKVV